MVMDFPCEIRVVFFRGLEDDARVGDESVLGEVDAAEGAFADQAAEGVVADGVEVGGGEFGEEGLVGGGELCYAISVCELELSGCMRIPLCAVPALHTRLVYVLVA